MWVVMDEMANWPSDENPSSLTPKTDVPLYFGEGDDKILIGHADVSANGRCVMRFDIPGHDVLVQAVSDSVRPGEFSLGFIPNPLELLKQEPLPFEPKSYFKLRDEIEEGIRRFTVDEINHKLLHGNETAAETIRNQYTKPFPFKKKTTEEDESS